MIDRLELEFGAGLSLFTGETGSGKSILVDAVGLLLGRRASTEMIREGFDRARVEGIFRVSPRNPARNLLSAVGIELDHDEIVVRREISLSGSNKVFVNGVLSTQGFLAELGGELADIHGQHEQQRLLQPREHLLFLDAFGREKTLLERVARLFQELRQVGESLRQITSREQERLRRIDLIEFQIQDIDRLELVPGLEQQLLSERQLLTTAEKRLQASAGAYQALYDQDGSLLEELGKVAKSLDLLGQLDPGSSANVDKLAEARFRLEEVAFDLRDYVGSVEFNPARLEAIETRLAELAAARRKYASSVEEILEYRQRIEQELGHLQEASHHAEELSLRESRLTQDYLQAAQQLAERRQVHGRALAAAVERELADLAMASTVFRVDLQRSQEERSEQGTDRVEFLISPNTGESPKPLGRIASGGELSRIILALKSILTLEDYPKTLIFDEVDAGLGGRVAAALGEKLSRLAEKNQVFCVTHLPQVAAAATHHYYVDKARKAGRTEISVRQLDQEGRVRELARMLAGKTISETALKQAREMLSLGAGG